MIQISLISLGASVASRLDHNKSIYKREVKFQDNNIVDVPKNQKTQNNQFLCQCMDIQSALLNESKKVDIINIRISNMILEQFIQVWLNDIKKYISYTIEYVKTHITNDTIKNVELTNKLNKLEKTYNLNLNTCFGVIRYIDNRMQALETIDKKIHKAYTRITLNIARSQAMNNDHALDNFQNGFFGLKRAISSYDYLSNARFPGHAKWWIKQSVLFRLKQTSNIITVSTNTWQQYARIETEKAKIEAKLGESSIELISEKTGHTHSYINNIYKYIATSQVSSLDYPLTPEGFNLSHVKENDNNSNEIKDNRILDIHRKNILSLIDVLPKNLKKLICLQYNLYVDQELDVKQVEKEKNKQILAKFLLNLSNKVYK